MINIEDCALIKTNSLYVYVSENKEKMLKTVKNQGTVGIGKRKKIY